MKSLIDKITKDFPDYSPSLIQNLLFLSLCILRAGTVNLYKLRGHFAGYLDKEIKLNSAYTRMIRVFINFGFSRLWLDLLIYIFSLLRLKTKYLILDGTSWKRNGVKRHYLTLSLLYKSVSIPIYFIDLGKLGISSIKERKKLFRRVFKVFDLSGKILLADREYIGTDWFNYLTDNGLDFIIRLRHKNYQSIVDSTEGLSYDQMYHKIVASKRSNKTLLKRIKIEGKTYTFVMAKNRDKNAKDKVLFLLSSKDFSAKLVAECYGLRWQIECCFKHLKSNGFNLELINLKGKARSRLLIAIVIFTYILAIDKGLKILKKIGKSKESIFRIGLDSLIAYISSVKEYIEYIYQVVNKSKRKYSHQSLINV